MVRLLTVVSNHYFQSSIAFCLGINTGMNITMMQFDLSMWGIPLSSGGIKTSRQSQSKRRLRPSRDSQGVFQTLVLFYYANRLSRIITCHPTEFHFWKDTIKM